MLWKYILVFIISMLPIIELRGAIPVALSPADSIFFGSIHGLGLPLIPAYITCIIGNMLPAPFIFFFARRFLEWGKDKKLIGKFCQWCLKKGEKGGKKLQSKAGRGVYIALLFFVGIPIPGTGAWTGTLAASFLDLNFKKTVIAAMAGVLMAGIIMMAVSAGLFSFIG